MTQVSSLRRQKFNKSWEMAAAEAQSRIVSGSGHRDFQKLHPAFLPFIDICLNRWVTIWSKVAQHPVQTMVSAILEKKLEF